MELVHFSKRRVVYLLVFVVGLSFCYADKVDRHLKSLNKTPVKTIKSADGDIIDCIHISQQPALDHPSLKDHSIQRSPACHPQGSVDKKKASIKGRIKQVWQMNGVCPEETIPIRRTSKEEKLFVESFHKKGRRLMAFPASKTVKPEADLTGHEYAVAYVPTDTYYGGEATINLWDPKVEQPDEFSLSQTWVVAGPHSDVNTLEAGWQVYPNKYKDSNPRLFIFWTADGYAQTGCYNLECPGFVQTSNAISLGGSILSPTSSYQDTQYDITILIWKDPQEDKWWLKVGDDQVGYWPSTLFTHLAKSADGVQWGGEIINKETGGHHTTTEMGSGHFPKEGFGKSSYFKNIKTVDGSNTLIPASNLMIYDVSHANCYNISIGDVSDADWGMNFFYGGPGGNDVGCP